MKNFDFEIDLTDAQEKRRRSIERRLRKALREFKDLAVEAGCKEPALYYECEGSLCCFDMSRDGAWDGFTQQRQNCVALSVDLAQSGYILDCGAW